MEAKLLSLVVIIGQISFLFGLDVLFTSVNEIEVKNPLIRFDKLEVQKLNKKDVGLGGVLVFTQDLPMMATIMAKTAKKGTNGYVDTAGGSLNNVPFCPFYKSDQLIMPDIIAKTDLTTTCPIKKGEYNINGLKINSDRALPNLPAGQYKTELWIDNMGTHLGGMQITYDIK